MKFDLCYIFTFCLMSAGFGSTAYSKAFQDFVGTYKINSIKCVDTLRLKSKDCSDGIVGKDFSIVMTGSAGNIPCLQEPGMQRCLINTIGLSATEAKYDSIDLHGTLRINVEMNDVGPSTVSVRWRQYDNPTYGKFLSLPPTDNLVFYILEKK